MQNTIFAEIASKIDAATQEAVRRAELRERVEQIVSEARKRQLEIARELNELLNTRVRLGHATVALRALPSAPRSDAEDPFADLLEEMAALRKAAMEQAEEAVSAIKTETEKTLTEIYEGEGGMAKTIFAGVDDRVYPDLSAALAALGKKISAKPKAKADAKAKGEEKRASYAHPKQVEDALKAAVRRGFRILRRENGAVKVFHGTQAVEISAGKLAREDVLRALRSGNINRLRKAVFA